MFLFKPPKKVHFNVFVPNKIKNNDFVIQTPVKKTFFVPICSIKIVQLFYKFIFCTANLVCSQPIMAQSLQPIARIIPMYSNLMTFHRLIIRRMASLLHVEHTMHSMQTMHYSRTCSTVFKILYIYYISFSLFD